MNKLKVIGLLLILIPKLALADRLICNQGYYESVYDGVYTGATSPPFGQKSKESFESKGKGRVLFSFDSCQVLLDEGDE